MAKATGERKQKPAYSGRELTEKEIEKITDRAVKRAMGTGRNIGTNSSIETNPDVKRDDIRRIIGETMKWYGRPMVRTDEECAERLEEYFNTVAQTGEIPTFEKMCVALGTYREVVYRWERGDLGETRRNLVKSAKEILASLDAALVSENKIPQVTYIFRSKNYFGLRDKTEVEVMPNTQLEPLDTERAKARYLEQSEIIEG